MFGTFLILSFAIFFLIEELKNHDPNFIPVLKRFPIISFPFCLHLLRGPRVLFLLIVTFFVRFLRETLSYFAKKTLPFRSSTLFGTARLLNKILLRVIVVVFVVFPYYYFFS